MPKEKDLEKFLAKAKEVFEKHNMKWVLTGGFAADLLVHHYRGEELVFHVKDWKPELVRELDCLPATDGPLTILDGFGKFIYQERPVRGYPIAPAPMVYAELIKIGNDRARETAEIVLRECLKDIDNEL